MNEEIPTTPTPEADAPDVEEVAAESTPIEPVSVDAPAAPCGCGCGCGKKKIGLVAAAAAVVLVLVVSLFGCGKSPAKQCLDQVQQFQKNVESGRADRVFKQLPESYRQDVRDLATSVADKFGETFFDDVDQTLSGKKANATSDVKYNGTFVTDNYGLLTELLRDKMYMVSRYISPDSWSFTKPTSL